MYAVIAYMDTVAGVYFPRGGMRALPDALAAAAADAGVEFRYGSPVTALERTGSPGHGGAHRHGRAHRAATRWCSPPSCRTTYRLLGRTPRRLLPLRPSPSAVVAACRLPTRGRELAHHTILFGGAWEQTFREIIRDGR